VCVYVCMCVCVWVCMIVHMCRCLSPALSLPLSIAVCVRACVRVCVCVCIIVHTCRCLSLARSLPGVCVRVCVKHRADPEERNMLTRVKVTNSKTQVESFVSCAAAFIAIGHDPNTKFVKDQIDMDNNGNAV